MPWAAPKPCLQPDCRKFAVANGRCKDHQKLSWSKRQKAQKLTTTEKGYGWKWQKLRLSILRRDMGLCQPCKRDGRVTLATAVDHVLNKAQGGDDDSENLQSICEDCHRLKTQYEAINGGDVSFYPEWLPAPSITVTVVCGRPGSGKSSYVAERAGRDDLVIDLDEIAAKAFGVPLFHASSEQRRAAVRVRNAMLASLAGRHPHKQAWLIATAGSEEKREFWARKYGPIVVLKTSLAECIRRINADPRRPLASRAASILAAKKWG